MSIEFGIFNAEGLIAGDFYSEQLANEVRVSLDDPEAFTAEVCVSHTDQPAEHCEECA